MGISLLLVQFTLGNGDEMSSMRNGSGDEYFVLFISAGTILKGFAHESSMSPFANDPPHVWPGIFDSVPPEFSSFMVEPAFSINETTFCIWRKYTDESWVHGDIVFPNENDPDGSADLLHILDGSPITYQQWAEEYYERSLSIAAIQHIYANRQLSQAVIAQLNSALLVNELQKDIKRLATQLLPSRPACSCK